MFHWMSIVICSLLASKTVSIMNCQHIRHSATTRVVAHVGSTVKLNCSSILDPNSSSSSNITWYKFSQPLQDVTFRPMNMVFKYGHHLLWLNELLLADAGRYECVRVARGTETVKKAFSLSVKDTKSPMPPSVIKSKIEFKSISVRQKIDLVCKSTSGTIPYFTWFYRNSENSTNSMPNMTEIVLKKPRQVLAISDNLNEKTKIYEDLLTISNQTNHGSGIYVCLVFNKHGKDYKEIHLTVFTEPTSSLKDIDALEATKKKGSSISSKIPMIILIALPAVLFLLSCTAIVRSMERSRQARKAAKKNASSNDSKDFNDNQVPTVGIRSNYNYTYCNHNDIRTMPDQVVVDQFNLDDIEVVVDQRSESDDVEVVDQRFESDDVEIVDDQRFESDDVEVVDDQRFDSELDSTSSSSVMDVEGTSSAFANHSNVSRPSSSYPFSSTEAPISTPPPELSSSSADLEWEGMDLCLPEGSELVQMSKEAEV